MSYVAVIIGLSIGNFLWEALHSKDWESATKLSFFQAVAVVFCAWTNHVSI